MVWAFSLRPFILSLTFKFKRLRINWEYLQDNLCSLIYRFKWDDFWLLQYHPPGFNKYSKSLLVLLRRLKIGTTAEPASQCQDSFNILEDELIAAVCVTEHSHSSKNRSQLRDLRRTCSYFLWQIQRYDLLSSRFSSPDELTSQGHF